jgi:hypothetical protein
MSQASLRRGLFLGLPFLGLLIALKLLNDFVRYDSREYQMYEPYTHLDQTEALVIVRKNLDLFVGAPGQDYLALRTAGGGIVPLNNRYLPGSVTWSKDGDIVAFQGTLYLSPNSECDELRWEDAPAYTFAYDFTTHQEVCRTLPKWQMSRHILEMLERHGGPVRSSPPAAVVIGVSEQQKFEQADVNRHTRQCD